jgi:valyl-tRNA synthetase
VAGELEALVGGRDGESSAGDRTRLERELAEAEGFLIAARARLANEAFVSKAPPAVVEGARAREAELAETVQRLRSRLGDG